MHYLKLPRRINNYNTYNNEIMIGSYVYINEGKNIDNSEILKNVTGIIKDIKNITFVIEYQSALRENKQNKAEINKSSVVLLNTHVIGFAGNPPFIIKEEYNPLDAITYLNSKEFKNSKDKNLEMVQIANQFSLYKDINTTYL